MKIGSMNHPGRDPITEIIWLGEHHFDYIDFTFSLKIFAEERKYLLLNRDLLKQWWNEA